VNDPINVPGLYKEVSMREPDFESFGMDKIY
jgi:hypothetical protein